MKCCQIKGGDILEGIDAGDVDCDKRLVKDGRVHEACPGTKPYDESLVPEALRGLVSRSRVRLVPGERKEGLLVAVSPEEWMPDFERGDMSMRIGMSGSVALLECHEGQTCLVSTRLDDRRVIVFDKQIKLKEGDDGDPDILRGVQNSKKARKVGRKAVVPSDRGAESGIEAGPAEGPGGSGEDVPR